jgi:hypothetical protein
VAATRIEPSQVVGFAGLAAAPLAVCEKEAVLFLEPQRSALSWRRRYSTTFQLASGLYWAIEAPRAAVFGPRSFWKTTPFSPQIKVSTPLSP